MSCSSMKSVLNPYALCSVHECFKIWQVFLGSEGLVRVFIVHQMGVTRNLQAVPVTYIFRFYLCDKKLIEGTCKCETHFLLFTAISYEHKHVSDLSMLVFCFRGHTFMVYLRITKVHNDSVFKKLTLHFLLQKSHLWNPTMPWDFQSQIPSMPSEFHKREPPLPSRNPKGRPWYRYGYFLESPILLNNN